jgi:uncharacterized membrane protein
VKSVFTIDYFYEEGARSGLVTQLGGNIASNYISSINLINSWLIILLIGIGTLGLILRLKYCWFGSCGGKVDISLKKEFDLEYVIISGICVIILAMTVILPFLSNVYDLNRIYLQTSIVLSVVFIYGCKCVTKIISICQERLKPLCHGKKRSVTKKTNKMTYAIILAVLIPHLLFVANIPQELTGNADWIILNSTCPAYERFYIHDSDTHCIEWWSSNKLKNDKIESDHFGTFHMISQGNIIDCLQIPQNSGINPEKYAIYLRETNIVKNKIYYDHYTTENTSDFLTNKYKLNKLYSAPAVIFDYNPTI